MAVGSRVAGVPYPRQLERAREGTVRVSCGESIREIESVCRINTGTRGETAASLWTLAHSPKRERFPVRTVSSAMFWDGREIGTFLVLTQYTSAFLPSGATNLFEAAKNTISAITLHRLIVWGCAWCVIEPPYPSPPPKQFKLRIQVPRSLF